MAKGSPSAGVPPGSAWLAEPWESLGCAAARFAVTSGTSSALTSVVGGSPCTTHAPLEKGPGLTDRSLVRLFLLGTPPSWPPSSYVSYVFGII